MDICRKAAESATIFEKTNTELKRQYLIHNIMLYNFWFYKYFWTTFYICLLII